MARAAGYDIWVVDPRGAFATGARFPEIALHAEWPDEIIPKIGLDERTAFIALTHDPKIDDPALEMALRANVFYIGALGSKKTQASRLERLKAKGFADNRTRPYPRPYRPQHRRGGCHRDRHLHHGRDHKVPEIGMRLG